jgi:hypothetical protein
MIVKFRHTCSMHAPLTWVYPSPASHFYQKRIIPDMGDFHQFVVIDWIPKTPYHTISHQLNPLSDVVTNIIVHHTTNDGNNM